MTYIIFTLGLLIGSFLNVCIYRLPLKQSIAFPPSHCMSCETNLKSRDLIPVLSYLITKGKCRYCGDKISPQYLLVELLNAILYLLLYLEFGYSLNLIFYLILVSTLIVISFIDYVHKIIPDRLNLLILILGMISLIFDFSSSNLYSSLLGFLVGGGLFLLIAILSGGAMGGGDIKLMAVLGLFFGIKKIMLITLLSFVSGAVISIILLTLKIKSRKDYIPFGPFIVIGAIVSIFYYNDIIKWYINYLMN